MLLVVMVWTFPLKVRFCEAEGTVSLSQLAAVFQNPSAPLPSQMLAAWAVGMSAPIKRRATVAARIEIWSFFWVFIGLFVVCMDKLTYIQQA